MTCTNYISVIGGLGLLFANPAWANCDLSKVVGYTLVEQKTIERFIDEDPGRGRSVRQDGFEGCDFNRIIVFTDNTGLRCAGYGYQYAYRPMVNIFVRKNSIKMCVESTFYDMTHIM